MAVAQVRILLLELTGGCDSVIDVQTEVTFGALNTHSLVWMMSFYN